MGSAILYKRALWLIRNWPDEETRPHIAAAIINVAACLSRPEDSQFEEIRAMAPDIWRLADELLDGDPPFRELAVHTARYSLESNDGRDLSWTTDRGAIARWGGSYKKWWPRWLRVGHYEQVIMNVGNLTEAEQKAEAVTNSRASSSHRPDS